MNTLKNIGIVIVGTLVFIVALRTGVQAEKDAVLEQKSPR